MVTRSASFEIHWEGTEVFLRNIAGVQARARGSWRPVFEVLADDMEKRVFTQQFRTQGAYGNKERWEALKPATLRRKIKRGEDPRILHATGRLERSLTVRNDSDHVRRILPQSFEVGTRVPYFAAHNQGAPNKNIPQRRIVALPPYRLEQWGRTLRAWLRDGVVRPP